jgi:hypothetical protein
MVYPHHSSPIPSTSCVKGSRPLAGSLLLPHYMGCAGGSTRGHRRWEVTGPSPRGRRKSSGSAVAVELLGGRGRIGTRGPSPSGCGRVGCRDGTSGVGCRGGMCTIDSIGRLRKECSESNLASKHFLVLG